MPYTLPRGTPYPPDLLSKMSQDAAKHRRYLRDQTRCGRFTLSELFDQIEGDRILGRTRIKAVLLWLPTFGQVKVSKVLDKAGVTPTRRLAALTEQERSRLLADQRIAQQAAAATCHRTSGGSA